MSNISEFISIVQNEGIARNNRYDAFITFPLELLYYGSAEKSNKFRLLCSKVNVPNTSYMTWEHLTYGEIRTVPYQRKFDPLQLTFYMDQKFDVKHAFDSWMSFTFDSKKRFSNYYEKYAKNCTIELEINNVDDSIPYKMTFYETYPKVVQEIDLGYDRKDAMTLSVLFQYKYYTVKDVDVI